MQYRQLGNTTTQVSLICLGTMTYGEQNTATEAHEQLDYALAQGINFIDTAELYPVPPRGQTQGRTETYIGSWLHKRRQRDQIILATKVAGPGPKDWIGHIRGGPKLNAQHIHKPWIIVSNACRPIISTCTKSIGPVAIPTISANWVTPTAKIITTQALQKRSTPLAVWYKVARYAISVCPMKRRGAP